MKQELMKNAVMACYEVDEHSTQGGKQTCQIDRDKVDQEKFTEDLKQYLSYDEDTFPLYTYSDFKEAVRIYFND